MDLKVWLEDNCQTLWQILNAKAKICLPPGLVEFIGIGTPSEIMAGRAHTLSIDSHLKMLSNEHGWKNVSDKYRRDLSGLNSENQVAELFCEIALCATLAKHAKSIELRPSTGKNTYSDCLFNLNGFDIYGEVKRYADPWPYIDRVVNNKSEKIPYKRSISKVTPDNKPNDSARPRSMDLRSKLRDVHKQLPDGRLTILFVFHSSLGESKRYITQALFGDSNFLKSDFDFVLKNDGLFSLDEWKNISACCLCRINQGSKADFIFLWKNPMANMVFPEAIRKELQTDMRFHKRSLR